MKIYLFFPYFILSVDVFLKIKYFRRLLKV